MTAFAPILDFTLAEEGGYVNDPNDPGGETRYGISKRAYPDLDIKGLTRDAAAKIYERDYWAAVRGADLPAPVAIVLFDSAVNCGVGSAIRWLQEICQVRVDGDFGPKTLAAALSRDPLRLAEHLLWRRLKYYATLKHFPTYARNWVTRTARLRLAMLELA